MRFDFCAENPHPCLSEKWRQLFAMNELVLQLEKRRTVSILIIIIFVVVAIVNINGKLEALYKNMHACIYI